MRSLSLICSLILSGSEDIKNAGTELNSYDDLQADMDRQESVGEGD